MKDNKVPFVFLLSVGIITLISVAIKYFDYSNLVSNGILTEGMVVKMTPTTGNRRVNFNPVISFTPKAGKECTFTDDNAFFSSRDSFDVDEKVYKAGDKIKIYYNPANPEDAAIVQPFEFTALAVGAVFGLGLIFWAAYIYKKSKRKLAEKIV